MKTSIIATTLGIASLLLSACGGGGGKIQVPGQPPPTASLQSNFGAGFAAAFNQSANADPREPSSGDVIALNPAADPVAVP